jgi:AraC family transcriptional regulator of adaptative response / DNA-3-methyladenine glycosylase II
VRAILGQQISVAAATTLARRLVERCGVPLDPAGDPASALPARPSHRGRVDDARLTRLFPDPAAVAGCDLDGIGLTPARAASLRAVAAAVAADPALLAPAGSLDALVERLCRLPGIGPWTAHYLAMRAFDETDAFPASDLGLRRAAGGVPARALEALAEAWRPWRAYAAIALWTLQPEETVHDHRAIAHRLAARTHRDRRGGSRAVRARLHRL